MKNLSLILSLFLATSIAWANPDCGFLPSHKDVVERIEELSSRGNNYQLQSLEVDLFIGFDIKTVEKGIEERNETNPFNTSAEETHLGQAKWSGANPSYGWSTSYNYLHSLYEYLDLQPGQRVVDIGSGHGRPGITLGFLYPESQYVGYEIVPERVQGAQTIANDYELNNVQFIEQDMSAPDFKIAPADYYYMYDPVNDETLEFLIERMFEANGDNQFKIILQPGGGGKYRDILMERFPNHEHINYRNAHAFIFDSKPKEN